jgi:hypothetical protein
VIVAPPPATAVARQPVSVISTVATAVSDDVQVQLMSPVPPLVLMAKSAMPSTPTSTLVGVIVAVSGATAADCRGRL